MKLLRLSRNFYRLDKVFPTLNFLTAKLYSQEEASPAKEHRLVVQLDNIGVRFKTKEDALLKDLRQELLARDPSFEHINVTSQLTKFMSDDRVNLADDTPLSVFTDGMFYICTKHTNLIVTGGTAPTHDPLIPYSLKDLEFPVMIRHDVEALLKRISLLCEIKYNKPLLDMGQLPKSDFQTLIIEALADNKNWQGMKQQHRFYHEWQRLYWQVAQLRKLDQAIQLESREKVRRLMIIGVPLILCNATFIAYGTFIEWSWDIVEPIAYFISSGMTFALASVFFLKWRRPFSYEESLSFLSKGFVPKLDRKYGFQRELYEQKQQSLKELEERIKQYFYMRI